MNTIYRRIAAFLLAGCLVFLIGCTQDAPETQPTEDPQPTLTNEEIYDQARAKLLASPNRIISYTLSQTRTVNDQEYTEKITGTASFSGIDTNAMEALVKETLLYGSLKAEHTLTYCDGAAFSQISGCTFTQAMAAGDFVSKQLPGALLDRTLYQTMELETTDDGTVFTFSQGSQLEDWVNDAVDAQLTSAAGTAKLDTNGLLVASTYAADYTCGAAVYHLEVDVRVSTPEQLDLSAIHPEHLENAIPLACLEAPKLLMQAVGDIFTARDIQCTLTEAIYSQAIPLTRNRQTTTALYGLGKDMTASMTNTIQVTDFKGQPTTLSQDYQFANGLCTSTVNGGEPTVEESITAEKMRTDIEDTILSGLFATGYLAGAALTDQGESYLLTFQGNDAYCSDLSRDIGAFLKMDLDGLASSYETSEAAGYLSIHKQTGLPIAMGMSFVRTHIFGDVPNQLVYKLDQTLQLSPS